jgi:glycosyltransferase involved in cell wall biosynthesis
MKILMILDHFDTLGGVETCVTTTSVDLRKKGHEVRVLSSDFVDNNNPNVDYYYRHINTGSPLRIFPFFFNRSSYRALKMVLKEFRPDIVHLHSTQYHSSLSIFVPLKKVPSISTTHGHDLFCPLTLALTERCEHDFDAFCIHCSGAVKYPLYRLKYFLLRKLLRNVDLFIAPSKHNYTFLRKHGLNPAIHLYNGIIGEQPPFAASSSENLLYVGRLAKEKGVQVAISALDILRRIHPHVTLTVVGTGPFERELRQQVQDLQLVDAVSFVGAVPQANIAEFYISTAIVLVPSIYHEAFVLVGVEAMNLGKPVIGSNVGGIPEWLDDGKTGFLVEPNNPEQISEKISYLLCHRDVMKEIGENAREKARTFLVTHHTDQLVNCYEQIIERYKSHD